MRKTRRGAAFYVETLLLVLFLLLCLAVLVRMLGASRAASQRAQDLTAATAAAQSAAETLAASGSAQEFAALLGAQEDGNGGWALWLNTAGLPAQSAEEHVYRLEASVQEKAQGPGIMLEATICVLRDEAVVYTLETQRYVNEESREGGD